MFQGISQLACEGGSIHGSIQEGVNIGLLVGGGKEVIEPPQVNFSLFIPAKRIVPIIVPAHGIDLGIAKLQVGYILL